MTVAPEGATLDQMLRDGEIEGFIGPRSLQCFDEGYPNVGRLFSNGIEAAPDHYARTKIFPIMHVLGLRQSIADAHPWLPGALLKALPVQGPCTGGTCGYVRNKGHNALCRGHSDHRPQSDRTRNRTYGAGQ